MCAGPVFLIEKIRNIYPFSAKNLQESGKYSAFLPTKKGAAAAAPALALYLTDPGRAAYSSCACAL